MLSPGAILRHSSKLSGVNLAGSALSFVENIIVARLLAPALMGNIGFLMLWSQYGSLVRPGFWDAASREIPSLLGQQKEDQARSVQNVGLTGELVWLAIPVTIMIVASAFFDDPLLRRGMWLTAGAFVATTMFNYLNQIHWLHQRFGLITRVRLASRLLSPVLGVGLVLGFGAYGLLWKLLLVPLALTIVVAWSGPAVDFRWSWNRAWLMNLLQVGVPLSLISLFAAAFRMVDRTVVGVWLPREDLGYLTFALLYINLTSTFITDFGSVLQPMFWHELGRVGDVRGMRDAVERLALLILVAAAAGATLLQAAFPAFVHWVTPRYVAAIPLFGVLAFTTATMTATIVPSLILESSVVGRQRTAAAAWATSVAVNVALAVAAAWAGYGLVGIAWATVLSQCFITVRLYASTHRHLYKATREAAPFYGSALLCVIVGGGVYGLFRQAPFSATGADLAWQALAARMVLALVAWAAVAALLYWTWSRKALESLAPIGDELAPL